MSNKFKSIQDFKGMTLEKVYFLNFHLFQPFVISISFLVMGNIWIDDASDPSFSREFHSWYLKYLYRDDEAEARVIFLDKI